MEVAEVVVVVVVMAVVVAVVAVKTGGVTSPRLNNFPPRRRRRRRRQRRPRVDGGEGRRMMALGRPSAPRQPREERLIRRRCATPARRNAVETPLVWSTDVLAALAVAVVVVVVVVAAIAVAALAVVVVAVVLWPASQDAWARGARA